MHRTSRSRIPARWSWLFPVLLTALFANMLVWPQTTVEAKPLGAIREFNVTLKAPDLIVPNVFQVNVGDTIRFRTKNEGPAPHNLHIGGNGVDVQSPTWMAGQEGVWEHTFLRPGVYALYCTVAARGLEPLQHRHLGPMEGVIVVTEPGQTADLSRYETRAQRLDAVNNSGVGGAAYLQPSADGSWRVRVQLTGLKPGTSYQAGLYGRSGAGCSSGLIGNLSGPVTASSASGMVLFTSSGPTEPLYYVGVRDSSGNVACSNPASAVTGVGNQPAGGMTMSGPTALPRTGATDAQAMAMALFGLGAVLTGSAFTLRLRRRRA